MRPFIFDATPLIYLGKVSLIENIRHFPENKYTTRSIYKEVVEEGKARGKPEAFIIENFIENGIMEIKEPSNKKYINFLLENPKIHKGDADVLALASELDGIAILDDEEARGMAQIEGREHHGTIFLLLRMLKMKLVTEEETLAGLNEMIRMGWRCSTELYAEIYMAIREKSKK